MSSLKLNNLSKVYGDKTALKPTTALFQNGIIGLVGANGAGKSTLFRLIAQLETPSQGYIELDGVNVTEKPEFLRGSLGLLLQNFGCYEHLTAYQFLTYMAGVKGLPAKNATVQIESLLQQLNLTHVKDTLLSSFSGGMRQRVGIAQALLGQPKLLILDEPTVGLDPQERVSLRKILTELGQSCIVLLSSHIVSDMETLADQIVVMNKGEVLAHLPTGELLRSMQGKVWETCVAPSNVPLYEARFTVAGLKHQSQGVAMRIIANEAPDQNATQIDADLEDAYLFFSRNCASTAENGGVSHA